MIEPLALYVRSHGADYAIIEADCGILARAVELHDQLRASGFEAELISWTSGRASFAVHYCGAATPFMN